MEATQTARKIKTTLPTGTISHAYLKPGTRRSIIVEAARTSGETKTFATAKAAKAWLEA